jgi:hypothetical protein
LASGYSFDHFTEEIVKVVSIAVLTFLIASPLAAQQMPDEDTKLSALKRGSELNGRSMDRWGSIDVSKEALNESPAPSVEPPIVSAPKASKPPKPRKSKTATRPPKPREPQRTLRASSGMLPEAR